MLNGKVRLIGKYIVNKKKIASTSVIYCGNISTVNYRDKRGKPLKFIFRQPLRARFETGIQSDIRSRVNHGTIPSILYCYLRNVYYTVHIWSISLSEGSSRYSDVNAQNHYNIITSYNIIYTQGTRVWGKNE